MSRASLCGAVAAISLAAAAPAQIVPAPVTLERTELHTVRSSANDTDYQLYVALPSAYVSSDTARYPVVYVLDGDTQFALVTQTYRLQTLGHGIRDAIIVGIGYPTSVAAEVYARRSHDMTPTRVAYQDSVLSVRYGRPVTSGGATAFLEVLKKDIIPFVERRYRTSAERVFFGYSFGGLFGAYVLFHEPELFSGYLLGSPSLWWDDGIALRYEEQYAGRRRDLPVRLVLSVGSLETERMIPPIRRLDSVLSARKYGGLRMTTVIFDGETHVSGIPSAIARGVRLLLASPGTKQ